MLPPPSAARHAGDPRAGTLSFLAGGGEMGTLMRAHDWSASSLGPPEAWPQALRTVVRLMLNTGHPMYIWWGAEGACLYNDAYRRSIGPERHPSSLGQPARQVWAEIWPIIGPQIEHVMSGQGATWHVDSLVPITRNGQREDVYWTYSYSPIDDDHAAGGVGGVLVLCTETTPQVVAAQRLAAERNRAKRELLESQARFHAALAAGRMGSWETDYGTMTRHWSAEAMALFGLALPGGLGQAGGPNDEYANALHPDDRHLAAELHALADAQDSFEAEYRVVHPDGTTLWLQGRGLVVSRKSDGSALRLVSIMADATDRKLAEERSRIEHERLELALSAGHMGAFDTNLDTGEVWWAERTFALFGVDPATFVPTPQSILALAHPDDRESFQRVRAAALAGHEPFTYEVRVARPDGTQAWLFIRGQAEYTADGRPRRSFGVVMDITERKEAEDLLRDADRKKDRFIATLAHELRNPLAPMRNAVQLLRKLGDVNAKAAWCYDVMDRQVTQMARLLDDLLDASRLSRGQLQLRLQALDLHAAIEQAVEIAQPPMDAAGHTFTMVLAPQPMPLQGDLTRLAQVFSNILINAAKYTPRGGAIVLTAAPDAACHEVVVRVTDNGIGIESDHVEQIFEMFGQVESALTRSQGGQGIGLALARGLLALHGGTIAVASEGVGRGSTFEVRLPLAPQAGALPPTPAVNARGSAGAQASPHYRVLVADDLKDSADSLAMALKAMGHSVSVAYDGAQAVQLAANAAFDIVLLDLGMPRLNGFEACRAIRALPGGQTVTIIAQTGWGQAGDRERTREAGFDHHLVKPLDLGALLALFPHAAASAPGG